MTAITLKTTACLLLGALALAACGKKGAPAAPGPQSEIVYPKTYPNR